MTATATKEKKKSSSNGDGPWTLKESPRKLITMDVRYITTSLGDNHRYPLSSGMLEAGYGMFSPLPGHPELPPLFELATSDDPAKRAEFLRVMNLYEGTNPADPTCIDLATSIHAGVKGQMYQIFVRENGGKKNGQRTFTAVAGHRRILAILFLWCNGLRKEPLCEVELVKGNNLDLRALQKDENAQRKAVTPIVVAQGYLRSINEGANIEQVAEANGVSTQTVQRWLDFLELEPKEQDRLNAGKLKHDDAIAIVQDRRGGGTGKTADGLTAEEAAEIRPAKGGKRNRRSGKWTTAKIEAAFKSPPSDWPGVKAEHIKRVLGVILGKMDKAGTAIAESSGGEEEVGDDHAVLPPEGVSVGLLGGDEELTVDDDGNLVTVGS